MRDRPLAYKEQEIFHHLTSRPTAEGWHWFIVRYRRPGSNHDQTMFQMHQTEQQAKEFVAKREPEWFVYGVPIEPEMAENLKLAGDLKFLSVALLLIFLVPALALILALAMR